MVREATTGVASLLSAPRTRRPFARIVHSPGWSTVNPILCVLAAGEIIPFVADEKVTRSASEIRTLRVGYR